MGQAMDAVFSLLFRGVAAGFLIGAPIGPVGLLCLKRALTRSRACGLASSLGSATADAAYGAVAGLGLTVLAEALARSQGWLHLIGGAFLCLLGVKTIMAHPSDAPTPSNGTDILHAYASTLLLTFANPGIFVFLIALLATLGFQDTQLGLRSAAALTAGIFAGSALWGLILAAGVALFHTKFSPLVVKRINQISGATIFLFGALSILIRR